MSVHCRAELTYHDGTEPVAVTTSIQDGRSKKLRWQNAGFELRSMASKVDDWTDPDQIVERHHPEVADVLADELGCDAVLFYPAVHRSADADADPDLGPIETVHSDYTERYQAMLRTPGHPYISILRPSMSVAGVTSADLANASRIVTLQLWRNVGPLQPDRPVAFCDGRTVDRDELHSQLVEEYAGLTAQFESFLVSPPSSPKKHRWHTFPEMTVDEVVLFRAYDSDRAQQGLPFWTPHTAFADPTAGDDAPARQSVELRAICMFR